MLYRGGASIYRDAVLFCLEQGAILLSGTLATRDNDYVTGVTEYRDVDSSLKYASVWVRPSDMTSSACLTYRADSGEFSEASCESLRPYICERSSVVLCKNNCFLNGICFGTFCLCDAGWTGEDCSIFHCDDVNNCFGNGVCVGPNQCRCNPGWYGRACTSSTCPRFGSCFECSRRTGCGWCDSTQQCLPGLEAGPDAGVQCPAWFYYQCVTVARGSDGVASTCSDDIGVIHCDSYYCNENVSIATGGTCQQCNDVRHCFSDPDGGNALLGSCLSWDLNACPGGVPQPDYSDPARLDAIVFQDNVIVLDPSDVIIYRADAFIDDVSDEREFLLMERSEELARRLREGRVLSSAQAGGIFVRIERIEFLEDDVITVVGSPAQITDAIRQADFREQDVPVTELDDEITYDVFPSQEILEEFQNLETEFPDDVSVHNLTGSTLFKCVGHEYVDANQTSDFSQYVVIPASEASALQVSVGDVIVSASSDGFLERVSRITRNSYGSFFFTRLSLCEEGMTEVVRSNLPQPDMTAAGGDNWPGLVYYEDETDPVIAEGEHLPGREAEGVFGRVINTFEQGEHLYVELVEVTGATSSEVVTSLDVDSLTRRTARRRKRSTVSISYSKTATLSGGSGVRLAQRNQF